MAEEVATAAVAAVEAGRLPDFVWKPTRWP